MLRGFSADASRVVWWGGDVPRRCSVCDEALGSVFVDCKTTCGLWGALCVVCAGDFAVADGPPLCRVFQLVPEGWVSIF